MAKEKDRQNVIDYLVQESEGEWTEEVLSAMSNLELMDTYLTWIGIIGFTSEIMETVNAIWNVDLS